MKLPLERFPIRWNHLMVKKSWYNKDESGRPDATGSKTALVLLSSMALTFGFPAMAQDANVEGRVGKLEKEMRAVQRQVFPNGAGKFVEPDIQSPAAIKTISPSSTATADLLARVDALEAQLATLTGQVEQTGNRMRGMEGRLKALETQLTVQTQPVTTPALPAASPPATTVTAKPKPKPAFTPPPAKPTAARTAAVAAIERPATSDGFEDGYNYGYRLWEAKFFPEARATLEETISKYPKHKRSSFARNLLGRVWLDDKKPATAVKVFYDNYKTDPRGERAPDSLFFLGAALTDLGKTAEACEAFGELAKAYPDAASGRLAGRIDAGKTRAKCK
jgi:TolA-binding protein